MKNRYDLNKIFKKEETDFHICGMTPSFNNPDSIFLADMNNCNLKEFNLRNLQYRIIYKSQQKRIRCFCPFQATPSAAEVSRLAVCLRYRLENEIAIIGNSGDGTFREEALVHFKSSLLIKEKVNCLQEL